MKFLLCISALFLVAHSSQSQLSSGLKPQEVKDMIMLCNSYTYLELEGDDKAIIPSGYKRIYTSPILGMDNKFQVYTKGNIGVLNFRGSTSKKISWMENFHSAMIPVEGEISIQENTYPYKFGLDTAANVHSGYALSLAYMHDEIVEQINRLNGMGIYNIILTGHSQGGALVVLLRSYLEHAKEINKRNRFKVYTFAQPMSGNNAFVQEYNKNYCQKGMSYSFINPEDMVPTMPMSYNDSTFLRDNLMKVISREEIDKSELLKEGLMILFEGKLKTTASKFGKSVAKQIEKEMGNISLPEPTGEINFAQVGNQNTIEPPYYPLELKDSSILEDDAFLAEHPRD